ncbi:MAG: RNA-directed DNA polymerase [Candidatus Dehalobacter alkaniphilus]
MANIVTDFYSLYRAYQKAKLGKSHNPTALRYGLNLTARTVQLGAKLDNRTYEVGPYYSFKVYEPKQRDVLAIDFEGKVMQHSFCDNVLEPCIARSFIRDNYASQTGKGTHDGLDRVAKNLRHYFFQRKAKAEQERRASGLPPLPVEQGGYADGYVLKGDFSKYFYSIRHEPLLKMARKKLKNLGDAELIDFCDWLLTLIINSTPDPGIPIGNQSSQLLALLYLDGLDHMMKDEFGLKYYGRYMDDFYIILESKERLKEILKAIEEYAEPLGLKLNHKTQIFPLRNGIDFLGYHTYITDTGKVIRKVRAKSKNNMRRKIRKFRRLVDNGKMTLESVSRSYASWQGHASHGNTYHLRKNMDALFYAVFPELKKPKGDQDNASKY